MVVHGPHDHLVEARVRIAPGPTQLDPALDAGGVPASLRAIAATLDRPTQVYDLGRIGATLRALGEALGDPGRALMAVKSFPAPEVLSLLAELGAGFEVSSPLEYDLLPPLPAGRMVSLNAPVPGDPATYLRLGNRLDIHLDGPAQAGGLWPVPDGVRLCLRVSHTALGDGTAGPTERRSRFGITPRELLGVADELRRGRFRGISLHGGSEHNTAAFYRAAVTGIRGLLDAAGASVEVIDLGGGLHRLSDAELPGVIAELRAIAAPSELQLEPGRILTRGAGVLLARVLDVRELATGSWKATLDASYECHAKWSDLRWLAPRALAAWPERHNDVPAPTSTRHVLYLVGASCVEMDVLAVQTIAATAHPPVAPGEVLAFADLDGYAFAWKTSFNGVPRAATRFV